MKNLGFGANYPGCQQPDVYCDDCGEGTGKDCLNYQGGGKILELDELLPDDIEELLSQCIFT